jgi:hypothetical protein
MVRRIDAIPAFQSFQQYLNQAPAQPLVKGVVKAQLNELPSSTHVVISAEGRRRLAAAQLEARVPYDIEL